jgi:fructokinase
VRIGVDLGGTKIEAIALRDDGTIAVRERVPTPKGDAGAILLAVRDLVLSVERAAGERCNVGIGTPGAISPKTGLLRNSNTVVLNGRPLDRELADALGREVRMANDANCFALSEAQDGAAAGARVVFGVILGTGCGGGIVVDGRALTGRHAIAGEWGHNPLPWPLDEERPGPDCYCGKNGCLETWLSGPGLARDHERRTGVQLDAPQIESRAAAGDAGATASLERYCDRLARALATVIDLLDPDVIVLGGGMSNVARLYDRVPELLPRWVFSDHVSTPIVRPKHGGSSGVRGAAWLASR